MAEDVSMAEVRDALKVAAAVEEEDVSDIEELRRRIRTWIDAGDRRADDLANAMQAALGPVVAGVGGRIDETGAIILPDELLFPRGKATLTPSLVAFLDEVCVPWVNTLQSLVCHDCVSNSSGFS
jgi:hypothetical protein